MSGCLSAINLMMSSKCAKRLHGCYHRDMRLALPVYPSQHGTLPHAMRHLKNRFLQMLLLLFTPFVPLFWCRNASAWR